MHEVDTGNILLQERLPIGEEETAGELHDRMKEAGAALVVKTVEGLAAGNLKETPQAANAQLKSAPKIFTETSKIDWTKPANEIFNLIRGLSPYPAAFTYLDDKLLKIYKASKELSTPTLSAGEHETDGKTYLRFAAADGYISIKELQLEGRKKNEYWGFFTGIQKSLIIVLRIYFSRRNW